MADGWYGEWTDWRNDSEQQAPKEPPKKRLHPYAFLAAGDVASQVHGARHPTASYAPEPSTANCLHASVAVLTG